jgi:membrane protein implicated in regulation of membrane protease activity
MIVDYIVSHQSEFWLACGFTLLVLEAITGFSVGVFLFAGLGAIATGGLMSVDVLPETWIAGISSTGISTGIITALLWKQLKKLQDNRPRGKDNSSDLIGYTFILENAIARTNPGVTPYSGLAWKVEIDRDAGVDMIEAGKTVVVSSVEVGVFKVKLLQ